MKNSNYLYLVFVISPILATFFAIKQFANRNTRLILALFVGFMSSSFLIKSESLDISGHVQLFETDIVEYSFSDFVNLIFQFILRQGEIKDIFTLTVGYLTALIAPNYKLYLFAIGTIYGYFMIKAIGSAFDEFAQKKYSALLYLFYAVIIIPVWNFALFRFWHAAWLFIYMYYQYTLTNNKRYLFGSFLSTLIHSSFIVAFIVILFTKLIGKKKIFFYISIVLLLLFGAELFSFILGSASTSDDIVISQQTQAYTSEAFASRNEGKELNWYAKIYKKTTKYFLYSVFLLSILRKHHLTDQIQSKIYQFVITFLFVIYGFKSAGLTIMGRFENVILVLICFYFWRFFSLKPRSNFRIINILSIPLALFYLAVSYRSFSDYLNAIVLLGNYFFLPYSDDLYSLRDLFKI